MRSRPGKGMFDTSVGMRGGKSSDFLRDCSGLSSPSSSMTS